MATSRAPPTTRPGRSTASLIVRAPSDPPTAATTRRSRGQPERAAGPRPGPPASGWAAATIAGRTGAPVTTARGSAVPGEGHRRGPGEPAHQPVGRPGHGVDVHEHHRDPEDHGGQGRVGTHA